LDLSGAAVVALIAGSVSFVFTLGEAALQNYSAARLLARARRRGSEDRVRVFLDEDERILLSCLTIALLSKTVFVLAVFAWVRGDETPADTLMMVKAGAVALAALLTIGRVLPLFIGRMFAEEILSGLRVFLVVSHRIFRPVTWLLTGMGRVTERLAGRKLARDGLEEIEDEILSAVEEGEAEGVLREEEAELIERALELRDADVADCMTPRTRIFALELGTPLPDAIRRIAEAGHSRVPVFRKTLDEVAGVLYAKDVLKLWESREAPPPSLARLARKPFFVPETKKIGTLLDEFKRTRVHMAIVLDEYGGTAGLITIEDILEELVGEIADEYDKPVDVPLVQELPDGRVEVDAKLHVDDLGGIFETELPSQDFDTVAGLVVTFLGRVPPPGEQFDWLGLHFEVVEANERAVNRVRVRRTAP
jgi:CBS domain containing-hemolysin-like protein